MQRDLGIFRHPFSGGLYPHFFFLAVIIRVIISFLVIFVIHYFVSQIFLITMYAGWAVTRALNT